jgi:hypothetical protein
MYLYYVILIVMAVIICIIASRSEMLRNSIFNQANFTAIAAQEGIKKPRAAFSLGRSQLAFWTVIIVSSFIYVLIYNSSSTSIVVPVLAGVNLALLGIAGGTTLVAQAIDNSQKDNSDGTVPAQQDYPSKNFLTDIISDDKGVSIHRLQNVIWTIVVGGTYIAYVSTSKQMPNETIITGTMLGLMGISAGTYLGLKNNENNAVPNNSTTPSTTTNTNTNPNASTVNINPNPNPVPNPFPAPNPIPSPNPVLAGANASTVSTPEATTVNGTPNSAQ